MTVRTDPPPLYHYTCQHGRDALGDHGTVLPMRSWNPRAARQLRRLMPTMPRLADLSWFTDLDTPRAAALGLTQRTITCDRTAYRYRVTAGYHAITPYLTSAWRRELRDLELVRGVQPACWWVTDLPVRVQLD